MRRSIRLYRRSLGAALCCLLGDESDSWVFVIASILMQVVGIVFLSAVFARVPRLNGWSFAEVALIYAMVVIAEGVGSLFFEGIWRLAGRVNKGELDYALVRPYPVILQAMSAEVGLNGAGDLLAGGALLAWGLTHTGIAWNGLTVLLGVVLFVSAVLVKLAINVATNSSAFWLVSPFSIFAYAMHQIGDLARYPITVYSFGIQFTIGVVVPFAFVSFFPVTALLGQARFGWIGLLTRAVAAYCVFVAAWVFRAGLRRYEGAGN